MPTVKAMYQAITHDAQPHQKTIAAELARESPRHRKLVEIYRRGASDREAGAKTGRSYGAARSMLHATMWRIFRRIHDCPRYWKTGRSSKRAIRAKEHAAAIERTHEADELRQAGENGALERAAMYRQGQE